MITAPVYTPTSNACSLPFPQPSQHFLLIFLMIAFLQKVKMESQNSFNCSSMITLKNIYLYFLLNFNFLKLAYRVTGFNIGFSYTFHFDWFSSLLFPYLLHCTLSGKGIPEFPSLGYIVFLIPFPKASIFSNHIVPYQVSMPTFPPI